MIFDLWAVHCFGQAYAESMWTGIPTTGYVCNGRFGSEGGHYMNDGPKGRSGSKSARSTECTIDLPSLKRRLTWKRLILPAVVACRGTKGG
jgi:hypothetical protein